MPQTNSITDLLQAGIAAEGLRQKSIASNLANLATPNYRRIDVKFEELLAEALDSDGKIDPEAIRPQLYQPMSTPVRSNGNDVSLETEMGTLLKNSLRHTAFVRLLQKRFAQIEAAMSVR
jgi:flagellar basal-body rod protein FlgB